MATNKKYLSKFVEIEWLDPTTYIGKTLPEVVKEPFTTHRNNGRLVHYSSTVAVLQHDIMEDGQGDFTTIVPKLITKITPLEATRPRRTKRTP